MPRLRAHGDHLTSTRTSAESSRLEAYIVLPFAALCLSLGCAPVAVSPHAEKGAREDGLTARSPVTLRIMSADITSGKTQSYDDGAAIRLFEGLEADIVLIQEFNAGDNSDRSVRNFIDTTFGSSFFYFRETAALPNGIISRYPILQSGSWTDPQVGSRGFAWAKIAIPGPHLLWAVSLHLSATSASDRTLEATALLAQITVAVPSADYLIVGGNLNTDTRAEACVGVLARLVATAASYPDDGRGNPNTSKTRREPRDWLMPDADLAALQVATRVAGRSFPAGLVFDSRVFTPLASVPPILASDSEAPSVQHMPIIKDFVLAVRPN